jgi:uncharacterized protein YuzE
MEGGMKMAIYTYDEQVDTLYILLCAEPEAAIQETVEASDRLHIDIGPDGGVVGIEILYPRLGPVDLSAIKERYGIELTMPFNFAA